MRESCLRFEEAGRGVAEVGIGAERLTGVGRGGIGALCLRRDDIEDCIMKIRLEQRELKEEGVISFNT